MSSAVEHDDLETLLRTVTSIETQAAEVGDRRLTLLRKLAELIDSPGGFWGWGRGRPGISTVIPVASISFGFTDSEWTRIASFCLSEEGQRMCQEPIFARMQNRSQVTIARRDIVADDLWYSSPGYLQTFQPAGLDDLLSTVRFCTTDIWCCLTLTRRSNKPPFGPRELQLIHLAVAGVSWLQPQVSESIPQSAFVNITPRQRLVMMFLLDGMSRKQIATSLGLTLHTVNDHVKALYTRFEVQSATELAARFLKSV